MMISVSDREENIVRKRENASYQHFLLFSQYLQKPSFVGPFQKQGIVWERVNEKVTRGIMILVYYPRLYHEISRDVIFIRTYINKIYTSGKQ